MKRLTALEYQKDEKRATYLRELQAQRERDLRDAFTCHTDLQNTCPDCHMIRSAYEIARGICDNCDNRNFTSSTTSLRFNH